MKNNRSHVARKSKSGKATHVPLPEPIELAQLAAILWPNAPNTNDALKIALKWYFDAVRFAGEHASAQIKMLVEQKQKDEVHTKQRAERAKRQAAQIQKLKGYQAADWADTVGFYGARCLLADPRKLAKRRGKLPKEGEPQPEPGMKGDRPLYELPGIPFEKLKTKPALIRNVVLGYGYMQRRFGGKGYGYAVSPRDALRGIAGGDSFEKRFKELFEVAPGVYKIPTIVLEGVLRYRYESHLESDRQHHHRKSPQTRPR
jgi:hypothetical protein